MACRLSVNVNIAMIYDAVGVLIINKQSASMSVHDLLYVFVFNCVDCPAGFTYIRLVRGCYKVVTHKLEWLVAGLECRTIHEDAHLLVINDAEEQKAVTRMISSINSQYSYRVCILFR